MIADCAPFPETGPTLRERFNLYAPIGRREGDGIALHRGFTLTELLVTVVIVGILAGIGVPAMRQFISDQRLGSSTNEFIADLKLARSEAIRRGTTISICKTTDATAATPSCDTANIGSAWTTGWIVFVDANGGSGSSAGNGILETGEAVLRIHQSLPSSVSLYGDHSATGTGLFITYNASGSTTLVPTSLNSENQLVVCDTRGPEEARSIIINPIGRVRVPAKGSDMNGNALTTASCS